MKLIEIKNNNLLLELTPSDFIMITSSLEAVSYYYEDIDPEMLRTERDDIDDMVDVLRKILKISNKDER